MTNHPPLEDLNYTPIYLPVNGKPPAVVKKWGPRSQLRWFHRMWGDGLLPPMKTAELEEFHCYSLEHKGACCVSCEMEEYDFGYPIFDDHCCCVGARKEN